MSIPGDDSKKPDLSWVDPNQWRFLGDQQGRSGREARRAFERWLRRADRNARGGDGRTEPGPPPAGGPTPAWDDVDAAAYAERPIIDPLPDVDVDRLHALLLRVEADAHRGGWDHNPQMRVLYDDTAADGETDRIFRRLMGQNPRCGPATRLNGYAAQIIIGPDVMARTEGAPWEHLSNFAHNIAFALPGPTPVDVMREAMTQPGVIGFAFVGVGWKLATRDRAEYEEFASGQLRPADHPRGREARTVYAIDVHRRLYLVQRDRGAKPRLMTGGDYLRGDFSNNLRLLIDGLTGNEPHSQAEYDRRYRTLHETVDAAKHVRICVRTALVYVDRGDPQKAFLSFTSDLLKFSGDHDALSEYDPPTIAAAFPQGREAILDACRRAGLGPIEQEHQTA